eukprot:1873472-Amphidinium_carterae.1
MVLPLSHPDSAVEASAWLRDCVGFAHTTCMGDKYTRSSTNAKMVVKGFRAHHPPSLWMSTLLNNRHCNNEQLSGEHTTLPEEESSKVH